MLSLTIDGLTDQISIENFKSFKDLFDLLTGELAKEERIITTITINGTPIIDNELYEWLPRPTSSLSTLSIVSVTRQYLIDDQLDGLKEHIEKLNENIGKAAEFFRIGDEVESQRYFAAVLEGLRWFNYSIDLIVAFFKLDIKSEKIGGLSIDQRLNELSQIVTSLDESQNNNDWIMLADQLEYELLPALEKWLKLIHLFKNYI